ncbi:putative manganese-dependent inorganic diphosphatase [Oscillospiraceae bacterium Marseille-Q3528]|nr:putative manganese-dependent inorganic diphosphatase [Oscillospiraceae bacterium Marseille-Q3528]WNV58344.1 putative manganese-dependent inorganic diphosphatase [Oscillospiraceae bacterium NTUH-002-81]
MSTEKKRDIFVIGHKNPDTDSICSAIAYADLKNKLTHESCYVPKRAGQLNEESRFVLEYFGVKTPEYVADVGTQVKDIEIRMTAGVDANISLKKAWQLMRQNNVVTLPITEGEKLKGLITIGDIAKSYMDVYESTILGVAKTQYANIIETIDGHMIVGDENAYVDKGKVLVAAANPDLMESYIEENDLVILGNRYESQLCAIEMSAGCIVVCEGAEVSRTIKRLAEEKGCTVIMSPHDTFTVARLINQSMPISYFMKTDGLVTFRMDSLVDQIKDVMAKLRHRDFPILDGRGRYVGMISRRNLMNMRRKQLILVDHNERAQAPDGIDNAEILEIIDHHRIGSLETMAPVFFRNQPLGCTATIIYQFYREAGIEIEPKIAGLLLAAIVSDTLMYRSPTCTAIDRAAAEDLAAIAGIDVKDFAKQMFNAGSDLKTKTPEEIFYQDFKKFNIDETEFGVGQISSMNEEELENLKKKLLPYMEKVAAETELSMIFFMLTNILEESTELIYCGKNAKQLVADGFYTKAGENATVLPGVVSRKKQLIPAFMNALSA